MIAWGSTMGGLGATAATALSVVSKLCTEWGLPIVMQTVPALGAAGDGSNGALLPTPLGMGTAAFPALLTSPAAASDMFGVTSDGAGDTAGCLRCL